MVHFHWPPCCLLFTNSVCLFKWSLSGVHSSTNWTSCKFGALSQETGQQLEDTRKQATC